MNTNLLAGLPSVVVKSMSYSAYLQSSAGRAATAYKGGRPDEEWRDRKGCIHLRRSLNVADAGLIDSFTIFVLSILYIKNFAFTLPSLTSLNSDTTASSTTTPVDACFT